MPGPAGTRGQLLFSQLPHCLRSCPGCLSSCRDREMCRRSYQCEARQPWLRAGLTGRRHYDSFTCPWPFCPGWIESRSLHSYCSLLSSLPYCPTHSRSPLHTPQSLPVWLKSLLLSSFLRARSLLIRICFYFNISLFFLLINPLGVH